MTRLISPFQNVVLGVSLIAALSLLPSIASARNASSADPTSPVVRAEAGNYGLMFRFGGLSTTTLSGTENQIEQGVILTGVGLKIVLSETWMIPIRFGTVVAVVKPDGADAQAAWGMDIGGGIEYHFRVWRRISPFFGANLGLLAIDPRGANNTSFGIGFGPTAGIEYYIADRVSIAAQYMFDLTFGFQSNAFLFSMQTRSGGALTMTYYF